MEGDSICRNTDSRICYFNPLPPHGGRLIQITGCSNGIGISIHSLRMEGDFCGCHSPQAGEISIHSLRMEGDIPIYRHFKLHALFQSTPSAWRETSTRFAHFDNISFQSTPSAWRETFKFSPVVKSISISIHSLRMEGDIQLLCNMHCFNIFQSTPSAWRETAH